MRSRPSLRRAPAVALTFAVLCAPADAPRAQETSGGFVVTLGADTVQVETFVRTRTTLQGTVVSRTPTARVLKYTMTFAPDGRPLRYDMTTTSADGAPVTSGAPSSGSFVYSGDSLVRNAVWNGRTSTHRIAAPGAPVPAPVLPYLGVSYLMYETAFAQARLLASGAGESSWYLLTMLPGQTQPQRQRVWLVGADSAEADYFGVARSGYRFNAQGRLVRIDWTGTTYKYRGVRVGGVDAEGIAKRWAAAETQGAAFGVLSPRDTARAAIGSAHISIDYSRPSVRGRPIWGSLVPWDTIWRLGADMATHFTTSADLTIGSAHIPAGTYTLWMRPASSGASMLVVNARTSIFGTAYPPANDFARIPLERAMADEHAERLTLSVRNGRFEIAWDDVVWSAPIAAAPASRASLAAAERALTEKSVAQGVRVALGSRLADDGAVLYPGAPVVHGRASVAELLAAQPVLDSVAVRWQPLSRMLSTDGLFAMTYGLTFTTARASAPRIASYASVWRWDAGAWRLAATLFNAAPPASTVPGNLPNQLAPLAIAGAAGRFVAADLEFTRLAAATDPANAFRTFAAADAVIFTGANELVRGADNIGAMFSGAPPVDWTWHPVLAGASPDGSLGFTIGESTRRPRGNTTAPADLSKYLSIWRREADGSARYVFDGGNARR